MITEVDEWYKDRAERVTFSDDIIKHTILANLPEVSEIIDISRRKKKNGNVNQSQSISGPVSPMEELTAPMFLRR